MGKSYITNTSSCLRWSQRWVFIIEGAVTIVAAFLGYALLPNYPTNTPWLTEAESALAQYRLSRETDGETDEVKESVFIGLKQCLADPKAWLLVLILTGAVVGMSFTCKSDKPRMIRDQSRVTY